MQRVFSIYSSSLVEFPLRSREIRDRFGLILNSNVRVPHVETDVRMSCQSLRLRNGAAIAQEFGEVSVSPCSMKIGDALVILLRDSDTLQIFLDHQPVFFRSKFGNNFSLG